MPIFPYSKILIVIGIIVVLIVVEGLAYVYALLRIMIINNVYWVDLPTRVKMARESYLFGSHFASYKINIWAVVLIAVAILLIP